jgi:hypothetical protein
MEVECTKPFKLAILICSMPKRADFLQRLKTVLLPQVESYSSMVTVLIDDTGAKRRYEAFDELLSRGVEIADYVAFIDDDDLVSENYVSDLIEGIDNGVDCCSLRGIITFNGKGATPFEYSLRISNVPGFDNDQMFERYPSYWNCTKSSIATQFRFTAWGVWHRSGEMYRSGLLRTEHWIERILYYHELRSSKSKARTGT